MKTFSDLKTVRVVWVLTKKKYKSNRKTKVVEYILYFLKS